MIRINQLRLLPVKNESKEALKKRLSKKAAALLRIQEKDILSLDIVKSSIDARKKPDVFLTFSVDIKCPSEAKVLSKCRDKNVSKAETIRYSPVFDSGKQEVCPKSDSPLISRDIKGGRPVIVGFGPAGMFAAYILALNGYSPLVTERGRDVDQRLRDVEHFWNTGNLDETSNVQFGEGGAGTFSDGKLNTGIKDHDGRIDFVLRTFVKMGAPEEILYDQHPHIGTDVLRNVVKNLRKEIISLGGEIRFESCLTDLEIYDGQLHGIFINGSEQIRTDKVILAPGHSARDTFKMLRRHPLSLEAKSFAVGYRVIHPQDTINLSQYGEKYKDFFGSAPYKLSAKAPDGRGIYSFCMCPGGYVVNASSIKERLCVNGMSYSRRDGQYANSAIIMSVTPEDFVSTGGFPLTQDEDKNAFEAVLGSDPLIGMYFQDLLEKRTYGRANGAIPVQTLEDYLTGRPSERVDISGGIKGIYSSSDLRGILPAALESAFEYVMPDFGRRIKGFDSGSTIIAGLESRTSSPLRILRDKSGQSKVKGLYPCGEGAGYAGGITSAAVDGIRAAQSLMQNLSL